MAIELRHLRYFLAVAHEGNVTRAAARLGISQPPLSQQMQVLERQVGTALLLRTPQGVRLTAAGQVFRDEALRIVGATDAACAAALRAAQGETGRLRLGFTASAMFNPVVAGTIRRLRRGWPAVGLVLEEANTSRLVERLHQGGLDAVFLRPSIGAAQQGLTVRPLRDEVLCVALPVAHRLAQAPAIALADLAAEDFVFFPRTAGLSLYDTVVDACRHAGFEPRIAQEAPQLVTVLHLVAAELGVSVVPGSLAHLAIDGVRYRPLAQPTPVARLALAHRAGDALPVLRHLLTACQQASDGV